MLLRCLPLEILVLLLANMGVHQGFITGRELLKRINSSSEADQSYAAGCCVALYEFHTGKTVKKKEEVKRIVKTAKDYLEAHRDKLDQDANTLLKEAFKKKVKPK